MCFESEKKKKKKKNEMYRQNQASYIYTREKVQKDIIELNSMIALDH